MRKNLYNNILQTKTVEAIIDLLKRARKVTKNNTKYAKDVNKDIDLVVKFHKKATGQAKRGRQPTVISDNHFTGTYKLNL